MSNLTTITDFTIAPGVRETASEDGAVLLDIEQGICFSLNPAGLRIWELLKQQRSLDEIADALGQETLTESNAFAKYSALSPCSRYPAHR